MTLAEYWEEGKPFTSYLQHVSDNRDLWHGVYRLAKIPDWAVDTAGQQAKHHRLLALTEDWCGDASNSLPVLAKLGEAADCLQMRVLKRDAHPDLMDRYLTNGSRSIPIVIALTERFEEVGHWGPRPIELQAWVMAQLGTMPKSELYPEIRRWYARDRGEAILREVLALFDEG